MYFFHQSQYHTENFILEIDLGIWSPLLLKSLVTKKHDSSSDMLKYLNIFLFSHNNSQLLR